MLIFEQVGRMRIQIGSSVKGGWTLEKNGFDDEPYGGIVQLSLYIDCLQMLLSSSTWVRFFYGNMFTSANTARWFA